MSNQPPQEPPDPLIGLELNGYQIRSVAGEGGMGKVYLAVHPLVGAKAAIKVMLPQFADDREQAERFVKEARVLATLNHDRIVKIMGFGNLPDGRLYMITEHLEGASLARIIEREAPMAPAKVLSLADQILDALAAAHAAGVVHRDLKPHNVIVKTAGTERKLKLLDFGLARARVMEAPADPSMPLNKVSQVMGTPEYMAPEQAMGKAPSPASDLYSLGVILFELLSHRLPFQAENAWEMMKAHVHNVPPRVGVLIPSLPQGLDELVAQLLAKAPEDRGAPSERVRKIVQGMLKELPEAEAVVRKPTGSSATNLAGVTRPPAGEGSTPRALALQDVRKQSTSEMPARPRGTTNPGTVLPPEVRRAAGLPPAETPKAPARTASSDGVKAAPAEGPLKKKPTTGSVRVDPAWAAAQEKAALQPTKRSGASKVILSVLGLVVAALVGIGAERFYRLSGSPVVEEIPIANTPPTVEPVKPIEPLPVPVVEPVKPTVAAVDAGPAVKESPPVVVRPVEPDRDPIVLCKDVTQWRTDVRTNMRMLTSIYKAAHPDAPAEKGPLAELSVLREMSMSVVDLNACVGIQRAVDRWEATYVKSAPAE